MNRRMMKNRASLVIDCLDFFTAWLCGEGLTSPGVLLERSSLKAQLEKIKRVKSKVQKFNPPGSECTSFPELLPGGWPREHFSDDLSSRLMDLDDDDRGLVRLAIELYLEETESLALFFGQPAIPGDLRELLDSVLHEGKETAGKCAEEVRRPEPTDAD